MSNRVGRTSHRAGYTLECGIWRATCSVCGHTVTDINRRQAASQFRQHIQSMNLVIDLVDLADGGDEGVLHSGELSSVPELQSF